MEEIQVFYAQLLQGPDLPKGGHASIILYTPQSKRATLWLLRVITVCCLQYFCSAALFAFLYILGEFTVMVF